MRHLPLALVQMCAGPDPAKNIIAAEMMIRDAAERGARLVCTPENTNLIESDRRTYFNTIHEEKNDPSLAHLRGLANKLGIYILIGSLAIKVAPAMAVNRSYLIDPKGRIAAHYDKIHLFDVQVSKKETWRESDFIQPGDRAVIADVDGTRLGMSICYDLRFPALYRRLSLGGAQILAVPSAFTRVTGRAHWEVLLRARAIENGAFVIAPAQGGKHGDNRRTWGHSMIIDPWGKIIAQRDNDRPGIVFAKIDLEKVEAARTRIPVLEHGREFTGP